MIQAARFYHVPPWVYAAHCFALPQEVFTSPAAMVLWTEWADILAAAEAQLRKPPERTTETF